jgi:hypothetical protein
VATQLLWASALPEYSTMPPSNTTRTPALPEGALTETREDFCRALRVARERRGVALSDIARATKVCAAHYEALERGDLRRWPKGIFRRTFFRGYAERIGVAVAETTEEFIRLFPDEDGIAAAAPRPVAQETTLRLRLDASWYGAKTPIISRLRVAMTDSFVVITLTSIAWMAGLGIATAAAVTPFAYFTLGMLVFGESPAAWMKRRRPAPSGDEGLSFFEASPDVDNRRGTDAELIVRQIGEGDPVAAPFH